MKKVSKSLEPHLERIQELVARIDEPEKRFSKIERDMLLSALRDMYDAVYLLESDEAVVESDTTVTAPVVEEPKTVEQPKTVEDPAMSVLLAEVDAEPIYAADPDLVAQEERAEQMPSVEEIEGVQNDDLFEEEKNEIQQSEPEPEQVMEPEPEPEAVPMPDPEPEKEPALPSEHVPDKTVETVKEQPKTLWEKLNDKQKVGTIAETMVATRTISDIYEAAKQETADVAKQEPTQQAKQEPPVKESPVRPTVEEPQKEEPIVQQHTQEQDAKQPSLFDYFKPAAENPTQRIIADSLGLNRINDIDTKLSSSKVKDLRTVININDKFSFMNELFRNNMKGYNDFIMKLNALDDRVEAQNYVNEIAKQYKWDVESLTVKTFYSIFDRKF